MAWSITSLANYCENNSGNTVNSITTGSLSIPANSLIMVFCHGAQYWPPRAAGTFTVSDSVNGTSWNGVDSQVTLGDAVFDGAGRAFWKSFTSSASGTITFGRTDAGNTTDSTILWGYSVLAITGHDTASPIVQAKGAGTQWGDGLNGHSQSVTLTSSPTSGNAVVYFLGVNSTGGVASAMPSGYTAVSLPTTTFEVTNAAYHTSTTAATLDSTDVGDGVYYAIAFAVEVKAATAGGGGIAVPWFKF